VAAERAKVRSPIHGAVKQELAGHPLHPRVKRMVTRYGAVMRRKEGGRDLGEGARVDGGGETDRGLGGIKGPSRWRRSVGGKSVSVNGRHHSHDTEEGL